MSHEGIAAPCTKSSLLSRTTYSQDGDEPSNYEESDSEFRFFSLVGTSAVSAATIAGLLLALVLGEGWVLIEEQQKASPAAASSRKQVNAPTNSKTSPLQPSASSASQSGSQTVSQQFSQPAPAPVLRGVS